ncbi:hypothetical protein LC087_04300 [Bacillus carboniphilus]|uniref:YopX protein domain-containing protein n=1 Tax=Bacillus carboniphilus TaxID=86663 RepID=A0ABY9JVI7_9BACI|nr:hypothetical protein [Bacillus carboniphilus]WLR43407.1 hypothetical protein LC087_04300 [Bacillus carboniphilus]
MKFESHEYKGWQTNNIDQVLHSLHEQCVVMECFGPIYNNKGQVHSWLTDWIENGDQIEYWGISSEFYDSTLDVGIYEWEFKCRSKGGKYHFYGVSIVKYEENLIKEIKEYQMDFNQYVPYGMK